MLIDLQVLHDVELSLDSTKDEWICKLTQFAKKYKLNTEWDEQGNYLPSKQV